MLIQIIRTVWNCFIDIAHNYMTTTSPHPLQVNTLQSKHCNTQTKHPKTKHAVWHLTWFNNPFPQRWLEASHQFYRHSRSHPLFHFHICCEQRCCIFQNFPQWHHWLWWCCSWAPWWWQTGLGWWSPCRSEARQSPGLVCRRWSKSDTETEERTSQKKRCNHCVFDSCFTQRDEIFHVFEWEVAVMLYLSLHDGYSIRKTLCHFSSIWNRQQYLLVNIHCGRLIPVNRQKLTFLNNGQFPGRTNKQKKGVDQ